jgi:anti-sigma factor RsiW
MNSPLNENEHRDREICRYLDGQMTPEQQAAFEREMLREPDLHREMERFEETDRRVGEALNALLADRMVPQTPARPAAAKPFALLPVAAAIAAMLLAVAGYFAIFHSVQPGGDQTPLAGKPTEVDTDATSETDTATTSAYAASGLGSGDDLTGMTAASAETAVLFTCEDTPVRVAPARESENAGYAPDPPLPYGPAPEVPAESHVVTRRVFEVTDEETGEQYLIQLDEVNSRVSMTATDL